jgi:hypothetical protein
MSSRTPGWIPLVYSIVIVTQCLVFVCSSGLLNSVELKWFRIMRGLNDRKEEILIQVISLFRRVKDQSTDESRRKSKHSLYLAFIYLLYCYHKNNCELFTV